MGITLTPNVNEWLRENGFLPPRGETSLESIESDDHKISDIDVGCIDLDTEIKRLLCQFEPGTVYPLAKINGHFHNLVSPSLKCKLTIAVCDQRDSHAILVPRMEVALERSARTAAASPTERRAINFDDVWAVDPHAADASDKKGFRAFLARSLARRLVGRDFVVLAPDSTVHGAAWLCELMQDVLAHTEGDTRIPAALCALRAAGRLTDQSVVAVWTNDSDSLWMPCTVGPLAAFHLYRPPTGGKKEVVLDLTKLQRAVEQRLKHDYVSWLFWVCLFHKTDNTKPPPNFCSVGNRTGPIAPTVRFDAEQRTLDVNRRVLRSLMFRTERDARAALERHFCRLMWSAAFYLLLQPDPTRFGWTDTPGTFVDTGILRLHEKIDKDDDGFIRLSF
jgi:hypothetical protein